MKKNKAKLNKIANRWLRVAIIIFAYGTVAYELFYKRDITTLWQAVVEAVKNPIFLVILCLIFVLMFVNIGLETVKWRFLVQKLEKISLLNATKSVLTGMTLGIFTPQKIGTFFGRAFVLKKTNPWKGVVVSIIGSYSQLLATLTFGTIGVLYLLKHAHWTDYRIEILFFWGGITMAAIILLFLFLFYFKVGIITDLVTKVLKNNKLKIKQYLQTLSYYSNRELFIVFLYSCSRYLIFSFQFWLSIRMFNIPLPLLEGFLLITVIYFSLAVIPTIALAELGIRGSVSLYIIQFWCNANNATFDDLSLQIFLASSIIWLINVMLPSIIGTFFVKELNFIRKKS